MDDRFITPTKLCIFNSKRTSVKSVLFGCEAWRTTQTMQQKIQTFRNTCLWRIYKIQWQEKIRNEDLWEWTEQEPVAKQILQRKWGWIGHTLRKQAYSTTRQVLTWNPQGKRKRSWPHNNWRWDPEAELKQQGANWSGMTRAAQNRVRWRGIVDGLCSTGSDGHKFVTPTNLNTTPHSIQIDRTLWEMFVGCFMSQQHASVFQGQICSAICTCCRTEIEIADQTISPSHSMLTRPTSPSAYPVSQGIWHGSNWSSIF